MSRPFKLTAIALVLLLALTACGTPGASSPAAVATSQAAAKSDVPAAATTAAAQSDTPGGIDLTKEVALMTWLLGDTPVDNDMVYGKLNETLKEKINTTLDINYIPWSDATTKYQLLFAAGESFDQCYTAFWTTPVYQVLATKNAFMELTEDMFKTYAPGAYEQVPDIAWKQVAVNGKVYTFPKSGRAYDSKTVVLIRGDLREKYDLPEVNSLDTFKEYLYTIAEKEKGIVPYQCEESGSMIQSVLYHQPNNLATFTPAYVQCDITDPSQTLSLMLEDERFLEFANLMKDFRDKGVIPSDAASKKNSSSSGEAFIAGKSAVFAWNVNILNAYNTVMDEHPEWKPEIVDPAPGAAAYPTAYRDGVAISPTSQNWERCLMVQELLRCEKELWDLTNYGIEGTHWEAVGDDKYNALPAAKNFPANGSCQWGWQTEFQRIAANRAESYNIIEKDMYDSHTDNYYLLGFAIDATNVKNIEAVMENLSVQYYRPLTLGAFDNPEATIKEYIQKLKDAGLDEYYAECQKQAEAYAARMK